MSTNTAPSIHIVVACRLRKSPTLPTPCSVDFRHKKQFSTVFCSSPNEHRSSFHNPKGRKGQATSRTKNKTNHKGWFRFLVAEMGFEPHDLRVMSPTSCQTAPLRDIMVPEAGVEPVREKISRDFKSRASANSAIPAFATVCSYTLPNYYST